MEAVAKATAQAVSAEIKEAVEAILAKHNLEVTKLTTKYGDVFAFNLQASPLNLNEDGINMTSAEVIDYQRNGYGAFISDDKGGSVMGDFVEVTAPIGTKVTLKGKVYAFAGVRSRGKNKLVFKCITDGKTYVFEDRMVLELNKAGK
jgi:hypothetical protein